MPWHLKVRCRVKHNNGSVEFLPFQKRHGNYKLRLAAWYGLVAGFGLPLFLCGRSDFWMINKRMAPFLVLIAVSGILGEKRTCTLAKLGIQQGELAWKAPTFQIFILLRYTVMQLLFTHYYMTVNPVRCNIRFNGSARNGEKLSINVEVYE